MKHAGVHWPENAGGEHPNAETILALPGISRGCTLICSPSARYWYRQARGASPLVVWRAIPRQGSLPAQLNWIGKRVADECLNLWDEQPHGGIEHFTPLNELQFVKEAGEDFRSYAETASKLSNVRLALRQRFQERGQMVRLMFPAWVPTDDMTRLSEWEDEARQWDTIGLHCYGSNETMRARYQSYRAAFPNHPLFVGEWNSNHEGHDERASLEMWAEIADTDAAFLGATYFIWETRNQGEEDLSIWGNTARLALFRDPPTVSLPAPIPVPEPTPEPEPAMPELPRGIDVSNNNGGIDWAAVAASGIQFAIAKVSEGTYFRDGYFAENWQAMKAHGLIRGAYHFAIPSRSGAVAEADYFVDAIGLLGQTLEAGDLLALDLEDPDATGDLSDWTLRWLERVEQRVGFKPLVYSSPGYIGDHRLVRLPAIGDYGLWLASWGVPTPPAAPAPWDLVAIHQTGVGPAGSVPGVSGDIDLNRFNGPIESLPLYGKPGAAPAPAPLPASYAVGDGVRALMAEHGEEPASDEVYPNAFWSETMATSGAYYRWLKATGQTFRYPAA